MKPKQTIRPFPISRQAISDFNRLAKEKNLIHGISEFDVSKARILIQKYEEQSGEKLSFTAFILYCMAKAIDQNKNLQGYRKGQRKVVVFDDVDVTTIIEIELENKRYPLAHILRSANQRDVKSLHDEIRQVQSKRESSRSMGYWKFMKYFLHFPWFIRRLFYKSILNNPERRKEISGTVSLSAVGMVASGLSGWGINQPNHTLSVALGGISQKAVVVDGQIVSREVLDLTIAVDHDIVDGVPAAQFLAHFKELVESAAGLENHK